MCILCFAPPPLYSCACVMMTDREKDRPTWFECFLFFFVSFLFLFVCLFVVFLLLRSIFPGGGGYSTLAWTGVCRPDLGTLTHV